ncbi:MAG: glycosyl transferase family 9, partial [Alphaproteobacteria bacterium]|nr:glycosyl transferase family 9 [Alphaproteobacteria bacterium]
LLITGSASEGARLQQQAPELLSQANVRNLCGALDLNQLATLIAQSDGLIASGTGPLHLAAGLGRPTLGLFPPIKAIDAVRWGALGRHARNLSAKQTCSACTDRDNCRCMQEINPEQVQAVVLQWCTTPRTVPN